MAKSGWSRQEDKLLFSQAEQARNEGRPLKSVFEAVAEQTGRKPNSIRNYYYARLKEGDVEGTACRSAAFVPFEQDDWHAKPTSCVADFEKLLPAARAALQEKQLQPLIF